MTVRVLFADEVQPVQHRGGKLRWAESFFLVLGLLALDYFIWVSVNAAYYQDYQSWSFDQQLRHRAVSWLGYLEKKLGLAQASPVETVAPSRDESKPKSEARTEPSPRPQLEPLTVLGRIEVPRLHMDAMVREGIGQSTLERAIGHIPSTALPGQPGNVGLAGHRDTFFRGLKDIKKDDRILLSTLEGNYEYQVESLKIVKPEDVGVLRPDPGVQSLTLVTCYPFYYVGAAPKRFIVRAREVAFTRPPQTGF